MMKHSPIISPNTVLANSLLNTIDLLRPKIAYLNPKKIVFVVGTQINGAPHLGTNMVQTVAFLLANEVRHRFSIDTSVKFGALDNAPKDILSDPFSFKPYQITYFHKMGSNKILNLIDTYYKSFFDGLSDLTNIEYELETYTQQQAQKDFRQEFINSLHKIEDIRWFISPSSGKTHIRIPCPDCSYAEKYSEKTLLEDLTKNSATFKSYCYEHGDYTSIITPTSNDYLDLNTIYRNVIKEAISKFDGETLHVMVKGGDWVFGCQLVDWALSGLGYNLNDLPMRFFAPQIVVETGAKLSKSLINQEKMKLEGDESNWILDTSEKHRIDEYYIENLFKLVDNLMSDPKHFFRSYSYKEIERIMNSNKNQRSDLRVRPLGIYRKYYDLIANGSKTIEVRVAYSSMRSIVGGQLLKFVCQDDECLTTVKRVVEYKSFDELFEKEDYTKINPNLTIDEQLKEIRKIFPKDKERLGVIAIEVLKTDLEK
jgi:ASC-1-like (ASCH) protein